jgi:glutaredoxin 3
MLLQPELEEGPVLPAAEAANNFMVKVYTTPVCPYCFTLTEFLKEHNIKFKEIDVSKDKKAREEMIKKSGRLEAPMLEINGEIVVGFNKEKICKLLKIKE